MNSNTNITEVHGKRSHIHLDNSLMVTLLIIAGSFVFINAILVIVQIIKHSQNMKISHLQSRYKIILFLNLLCSITYWIGIVVYPYFDVIEIIVEIIICLQVIIFYNWLIKAYFLYGMKTALLQKDEKLMPVFQEISNEDPNFFKQLQSINNSNYDEQESRDFGFIFAMRTAKEMIWGLPCRRCGIYLKNDITTIQKAKSRKRFYNWCVYQYVIMIPVLLIIQIIAVELATNESRLKRLETIIQALKGIFTVLGFYNLLVISHELDSLVKETEMMGKITAIKIPPFTMIVVKIILNGIGPSSEYYNKHDFTEVLFYFIMTLVNSLGFLLFYRYFNSDLRDIKHFTQIHDILTNNTEMQNIQISQQQNNHLKVQHDIQSNQNESQSQYNIKHPSEQQININESQFKMIEIKE